MKSLPPLDGNLAIAELCRRSFYYFFLEFWDVVEPEKLSDNWHIEYLCGELEKVARKVIAREPKDNDVIINIPPGTTKSTIATVMLNAWVWAIDPTVRFISSSYSGSVSISHAIKTRDIIRSDKYQKYFPDVRLRDDLAGKSEFKNTKGGDRVTTSTGGTITSKHAHIIIVDDPLNPKQSASEAEIESANTFIDRTLSTRKVSKSVSVQIMIMQRLHPKDPTGYLLKKKGKKIKHICLPGEVSDDVQPKELKKRYVNGLLDSNRLNKEELADLRIDLGSYGYSGQIMQTPKSTDGGIWQQWFITISRDKLPKMKITYDWDLAYTSKESNSASAVIGSGTHNENIYITEADFRWLEFPELVEWMKTFRGDHYVEPKASGKSAIQTLTRQGINAISYDKHLTRDKIARTRDVTPTAEAGRVYVCEDLIEKIYNHETQGILNLSPTNTDIDLNDALVQALHRQKSNASAMIREMLDQEYAEVERLF